jgi:hypothetical protein
LVDEVLAQFAEARRLIRCRFAQRGSRISDVLPARVAAVHPIAAAFAAWLV